MLLEYGWGNPAAAAAAMLLFGEESGPDQQQQVLDHHYVNSLGMDFFQQPQPPLSAAALFSDPSLSAPSCHQRYGLALPPLPPARIGLNLGERTYFSLASPKEEMMARRVCRRRTRTARCQAEGCGSDLTHAKHYHRRHKVCEFHSKASIVMTAGLSQRFCQQCSRFHVLSEFDQGKRSCRKRLAEHNRRRRKSQDLATPSTAIAKDDNNTANTTTTRNITPINQEITSPTVTHKSSSPPLPRSLAVPPLEQAPVPTVTVLSESSSTETSPPPRALHGAVGRLGSTHEHGFAEWNEWNEGEDGTSSIKIIYDQNH